MDGKESMQVDNLSKLTKIEELKKKLEVIFKVEPERQRLFYRGKQLEDGHTLFDYDVGLNDIVQLIIRVNMPENKETVTSNDADKETGKGAMECSDIKDIHCSSVGGISDASNGITGLYKIGDVVDAKDCAMGAWFESKVVGLSLKDNVESTVLYHVQYEDYEEDELSKLCDKDVRPRASVILQWSQISVGQVVMANYNTDEPKERGFWYDVEITRKVEALTRNSKKIYAKLLLVEENGNSVSQECQLLFIDEIFKIPNISDSDGCTANGASPVKRQNKPDCNHCKDDPLKKCKFCACNQCGGKEDPDKQLLCDECDLAYHLYCLNPPLEKIPDDDEWYCPECKNDDSEVIKAGEKLRKSKKKQKMASANSHSERDWGRGMACVGRTRVCTVVPSNHFGPIPGVPVGSSWMFRIGASEAGVHRPHVSGIHGREDEGSFSIVLAGGYEDDLDNGDEFFYTGSGGRDLSGNKRTAEQSCDQTLTKMNRALAKNCAAPLVEKTRVKATNWKDGKPVRVIRSSKFKKHSKYAPDIGNRYDGIYKVAEYWPEKGQSGFIVRRYLLRRDDKEPAPWTPEGQKSIQDLGLVMQCPEGYLEAQEKKRQEKLVGEKTNKGSKGKRKRSPSNTSSPQLSPAKKKAYSVAKDKLDLIQEDTQNKKIWNEILSSYENVTEFHKKVEEAFLCICCQEIAFQPVTTQCKHNACKDCLTRSFKAGVFACPTCRHDLGKATMLLINSSLYKALQDIFPGYDKGR